MLTYYNVVLFTSRNIVESDELSSLYYISIIKYMYDLLYRETRVMKNLLTIWCRI